MYIFSVLLWRSVLSKKSFEECFWVFNGPFRVMLFYILRTISYFSMKLCLDVFLLLWRSLQFFTVCLRLLVAIFGVLLFLGNRLTFFLKDHKAKNPVDYFEVVFGNFIGDVFLFLENSSMFSHGILHIYFWYYSDRQYTHKCFDNGFSSSKGQSCACLTKLGYVLQFLKHP